MKWEYKVVAIPDISFGALTREKFQERSTERLNTHGAEGWELVQIHFRDQATVGYFKRQATDEGRVV